MENGVDHTVKKPKKLKKKKRKVPKIKKAHSESAIVVPPSVYEGEKIDKRSNVNYSFRTEGSRRQASPSRRNSPSRSLPPNSRLTLPRKNIGGSPQLSRSNPPPISKNHRVSSSTTPQVTPRNGLHLSGPQRAMRDYSDLSHSQVSSIGSADSNVVWRTFQDKSLNPTRLEFERSKFTKCKKIKNEPQIEEINYQHNLIERMEFLDGFRKLVFLDFYDNRIKEISGLNSLPSLRVLMLGKNQIRRITGLEHVTQLDIIDLHSNLIGKIENMNHLRNLRNLNLSGNQLYQVENIRGLHSLTELNLRRNRIHTINELNELPNLERLFLSYNNLSSDTFWDTLSSCPALVELTLDGNPLSSRSHYKTTVLKCLPQLNQLDMRRITDGERKVIERAIQKEAFRLKKTEEKSEKLVDRANRIQAAQDAWEAQQEEAEAENPLLGASL